MNQTTLKLRLSIFMFLQYFIWSSWYMTLGAYLGTLNYTGAQIGLCYGAFAWGAIASPFIVGLIADRYFASEKLIACLGLVGGVLMCFLPKFVDFNTLYPMLIAYCALFVPTLALGNSLSLHHLADAQQDFPRIKIWSAVGWIAGGVAVGKLNLATSADQFLLAGGAAILFGLFAFSLPHTPPKKTGQNVTVSELLGLDALSLLKRPTFAIFILCMFLICIPLYFYFVHMGPYLTQLAWKDWPSTLTLAQISDIVFLFLLPIMLKRLGYKLTILLGILSWVARYFLLAASAGAASGVSWMILAAILMHGVCYDFLFIAGQLYVDEESDERTRGAAQGFIAIILWGFGSLVGTYLAGITRDKNLLDSPQGTVLHDWSAIWSTPAWIAVAVLIVFLIAFKNPSGTKSNPS